MNKIKSLVYCDNNGGRFCLQFAVENERSHDYFNDTFLLFEHEGYIELVLHGGIYVENSMCLYLGII